MLLQISFIIYICILFVLLLTKLIIYIIKSNIKIKYNNNIYLGLTNYQINYLIISLFLYLFLFYFLKSYITDVNIDYAMTIGLFYIIWYLLTKIIVNNISTIGDSI
jgi:hypothetical protein